MLPSRKQRREMARKFGLTKKNQNFTKWAQQLDRSVKAGQMIHQINLQEQHNRQIKDELGSQVSIFNDSESETVDIELPEENK